MPLFGFELSVVIDADNGEEAQQLLETSLIPFESYEIEEGPDELAIPGDDEDDDSAKA